MIEIRCKEENCVNASRVRIVCNKLFIDCPMLHVMENEKETFVWR